MKIKGILKLLIFPVLIVGLDLFFRWDRMHFYHNPHFYFYWTSALTSILFHVFWMLILKRIVTKTGWYYALGSLYVFLTLFIVGASFAFKNINDLFPNYYTLLYFKTEPQSAFMIIRDILGWGELIGILALVGIITALGRRMINRHIPTVKPLSLGLIVLIPLILFESLVIRHNKFDQCAVVDVNFFACVQRHLSTWDDHSTFKGKGLGVRKVRIQIEKKEKAPFNVLVILCESLRKRSMSVYGNKVSTTPQLKKFMAQFPKETFLFQNPFTVSTTTMLAVPATLSGIGPYQDSTLLYAHPLIWDYAKQFNYKRFFISSHTLEWYRFADFYKNDSLDTWWNHDNSGHPYFNDLGIRDGLSIKKTISTLESLKGQPFVGVIQLNTTHYPYKVPTKYNRWNSTYRDTYHNSVYYQDAILGELLDYLKETHKLENTVILLTSDHGESLMEHHNIGHVESNYYETIAIPLLAYIPQKFLKEEQRKKINQNLTKITSNIDIVPTLLDLWNIQDKKTWKRYSDSLTGFSLLGEIPMNRNIITLNNNQIASFNTGLSVINSRFHFLLRTNLAPAKMEWYHYRKDEKELLDLSLYHTQKKKKEVYQIIKNYPICSPFFPYLNSNSSKEMDL